MVVQWIVGVGGVKIGAVGSATLDPMSRYSAEGECESCGASFRYFLIHGGSNQSSYAYCDRCGATALLSGSCEHMPVEAELDFHRPVPARAEALLDPCSCGGRFLGSASPRCPSCRAELSPEAARSWLEARASKATRDWRWQGSWCGVYCIVIENRVHTDVWTRP